MIHCTRLVVPTTVARAKSNRPTWFCRSSSRGRISLRIYAEENRRKESGGRSYDGQNARRSNRGKSYTNSNRRKGRPAWQRSPDDTPLRDGNRDRLMGLLTDRYGAESFHISCLVRLCITRDFIALTLQSCQDVTLLLFRNESNPVWVVYAISKGAQNSKGRILG